MLHILIQDPLDMHVGVTLVLYVRNLSSMLFFLEVYCRIILYKIDKEEGTIHVDAQRGYNTHGSYDGGWRIWNRGPEPAPTAPARRWLDSHSADATNPCLAGILISS